MKKKSPSDPTDDFTPSRGKFRTFVKRVTIAFLVLALSLVVTVILCRKPIAARIIEQQLLASGFSRAEVTINTLGIENVGGTIKGDTAINGEFAEGQLTFFIHCPWQEIVNRTFGQLDITLSDTAILIDPTNTVPDPPEQTPTPSESTSPPSSPELSVREVIKLVHSKVDTLHVETGIHIGKRIPDQSVDACLVILNRGASYSLGEELEIAINTYDRLSIAHASELVGVAGVVGAMRPVNSHFLFVTNLDHSPGGYIRAKAHASLTNPPSIPFIPESWRRHLPSLKNAKVSTQLQWTPDDTLELRTLDIDTGDFSIDHPDYGKLTTKDARYAYSEHTHQLEINKINGAIRLPSGAMITLPEATPLSAHATATYEDETLTHLSATVSSDGFSYNHGAPMGSVDLGDISVTNLRTNITYRNHPSPWQRRAFITLRANTYGAAINTVGAFLTDLNATDPFRAFGGIAFSDLPLDTVDLPDALVPTLVDYQLAGTINGQLALGVDTAKPDPLTTLSLTANGSQLGIKHRNDPIHISGGELTIHFPDLREPTTLQDQRFSIANADAGSIHAKNITGKMSLDADANLLLTDVRGTSFGGTVRLNQATIPADDSPYTLDLRFDSVDAADLAALYPDFKGSITGELSGRVPIIFGSKTLPRAGQLKLDEDSVSTLRYDASALFSTDSDRDQILRTALADLNVTTLDVHIFDPTRPKNQVNIVIGGTSNKLFRGQAVPLEAFNIKMEIPEEIIFLLLTSVDGLSFE